MSKQSKVSAKSLKQPAEIITAASDPNFFSNLEMLPNPDPILRKLGKDSSVYQGIAYDAHVMSETRSLYSGLLGYEWRLVAGAEDPASVKAMQEIAKRMNRKPAKGLRWDNFLWNIYKAIFNGQSIHEIGWEYDGQYLMPGIIKDRPSRRIHYNIDNEPRIITRDNPLQGEQAPDHRRLLICRHMPSEENPYGVAVMSSCYWPWVFKHNGWRWFMKLAEKFGFPWAVGKYPAGTPVTDQQKFARDLSDMMEAGAFAIPEGNEIELITVSMGGGAGGEPIHERIINLANKEMSKALTSQTLSTEIQGSGSRAAAETHREREKSISKTDRGMVSETVNQLLAWITELNFPGATPPEHEFYKESDPSEDWAKIIGSARSWLPIGKAFAYDRMQITPPEPDEELIEAAAEPSSALEISNPSALDNPNHPAGKKPSDKQGKGNDTKDKAGDTKGKAGDTKNKGGRGKGSKGSDPSTLEKPDGKQPAHQFTASDPSTIDPSDGMAVDQLIAPIKAALDASETLKEFQDALAALYPDMDNSQIENYLELAFRQNSLEGREV